jgi:hypothetical protein
VPVVKTRSSPGCAGQCVRCLASSLATTSGNGIERYEATQEVEAVDGQTEQLTRPQSEAGAGGHQGAVPRGHRGVSLEDQGGPSGQGEPLRLAQLRHETGQAALELAQHASCRPRCSDGQDAQATRTCSGRTSSSQSAISLSTSMNRRTSSSVPS